MRRPSFVNSGRDGGKTWGSQMLGYMEHTLLKPDTHKTQLWEGILGDQIAVCITQTFTYIIQFVIGECPEASLGRVPVVGGHDTWSETGAEAGSS